VTPEERAARERKQKIFVVVGGLFLVGLLAIQLPKLVGGSSSSAASETTATEPTATGSQSSPTGSPVALVGGDAESGKLSSVSAFARKDPFVQQVVTQDEPAPAAKAESKGASGGTSGKAGKTTTFATGKSTAAAATIVTVNGARQVLEPGMRFPASDPLFVLVAEKPGSKSVVVGIAGGAYSGGAKTTSVRLGKPITLVNTTTGARYKITLVSVGSGEAPEQVAPGP
jgi:hypothetical protein